MDPINIAMQALPMVGEIATSIAQGTVNRKQRKWNEKMYKMQRADNLSDWHMQNSYNHPSSQMARLREANLNPNLIYGDGANSPAAKVNTTDVKSWNPQSPTFNGAALSAQYFNTKLQEAQIDNVRKTNDVLEQDIALKRNQALSILSSIAETDSRTARNKYDLSLAGELRQNVLDTASSNLAKLKADTNYTINQDERAALQSSQTLEKGIEEIAQLKANTAKTYAEKAYILEQINNAKKDGLIKDFEIKLNKSGISKNDNLAVRLVAEFWDKILNKEQKGRFKSAGKKINEGNNKYQELRTKWWYPSGATGF